MQRTVPPPTLLERAKRVLPTAALCATVAAFVACSGGGTSSSVAPTTPSAPTNPAGPGGSQTVQTTLLVAIPNNGELSLLRKAKSGSSSASIVVRYALDSNPSNPPSNPFAVPATATIANGTPVSISTAPGGNCTDSNGTLTCTLHGITLVVGVIDLYILDYDGPNGTGDLLYASLSTVQVNSNGTLTAPGTTAPPIGTVSLQPNPVNNASGPSSPTPTPTSTVSPTPAPVSNALIYVANPNDTATGYAIVAFPLGTGGNISPIKTIAGTQTQLISPGLLAFDSSGNLYVADEPNSNNNPYGYVTVYPLGSSGNAAPARIIRGNNTQFARDAFTAIAVDADGYLYVSEDTSSESCTSSSSCTAETNDTILVFAPGANGNVAPVRTINSSSCFQVGGIAVLPSNDLAVACMPPSNPEAPYSRYRRSSFAYRARLMDQSQSSAEIVTFAEGASGNAVPINVIDGSSTELSWAGPLAWSALGMLFVAPESPSEADPSILGFPQAASGDVAPTVNITGSATQLNVMSLAVDSSGTIYALNSNNGAGSLTVTEYASTSNGNVAPTYVIAGPNTTLTCPQYAAFCSGGIAIGPP